MFSFIVKIIHIYVHFNTGKIVLLQQARVSKATASWCWVFSFFSIPGHVYLGQRTQAKVSKAMANWCWEWSPGSRDTVRVSGSQNAGQGFQGDGQLVLGVVPWQQGHGTCIWVRERRSGFPRRRPAGVGSGPLAAGTGRA